MPLYEIALIQNPTKKEAEDGKVAVIILPPTAVIATDDRAAAVIAVANNRDKITGELSRVEVLVRPFC
jgi:hypothetical protein